MFSSFWKVIPVLTLGLGVGLEAQNANAPKNGRKMIEHQKACGLNEGECCLARSSKCSMGWATEFDFLYWMAENPGFPISAKINIPSRDNTSIVRLESKWDPGFRIGTGWNSDFDRWDLFADWTWYKNHSSKSRTANTGEAFYLLYPTDNTNLGFQNTEGSWRLLYNAIDLELGRAFYITKALSLRPHWGLRAAWLNQKFKNFLSVPLENTFFENYSFHGKNNYWGVGPRLGIHSQWHIADSNWSLLGKTSASLLFGKTKNKYQYGGEVLSTLISSFSEVKDHFTQPTPNIQIFLGIDWGSYLDCERYYLGINAGWEANLYWNQYNFLAILSNDFNTPIQASNNHPVTMEGLTVNVHFDF